MDRKDENRERRSRLVAQLSNLMLTGDCYVLGQKFQTKAASPATLLGELVNYLISNTYNKLPYLKVRQADPIAEIKAVLAADDIGQHGLTLGGEEGNPLALMEVREYLQIVASQNRVLLSDIVERFTGVPWGWKPEWEIVLLIARLFMAGEIKLMLEGSDLDPKSAVDPLTKSVRFKQVSILKRKTADATALKRARELHQGLFSKLGREEEDGLVADFRTHLGDWQLELKSFTHAAAVKHHPGKDVIDQALNRLTKQLAIRDSFEFIEALLASKDDWLNTAEDIHDVVSFYKTQIAPWRRMLEALEGFADNHDALLKDAKAAAALTDLEAIRDNPAPYGQISRIEPLIATVETVNDHISQGKREKAQLSIDNKIAEVPKNLDAVQASPDLRNRALLALQNLKTKVAGLSSIPKIMYHQEQAGDALDSAIATIEAAVASEPAKVASPGDQATAITFGQPVVMAAPKPTKVIRTADLATQSYLETEAEVEDYLTRLRVELLAAIKAGQRARIS